MIFPNFWQNFPQKLANLVEFMLEKPQFPKKNLFFLKDIIFGGDKKFALDICEDFS
jgi:hypothetical protein